MEADARRPEEGAGLHSAIALHRVADCDIFTGSEEEKTPWGRVFGGQVMAQALLAAQATVPAELPVHSLHGYFLLAGTSGIELLFRVDRVRDGKSFATREVKAFQRNAAIFQMSASFHAVEWGPGHQTKWKDYVDVILKARGLDRKHFNPQALLEQGKKTRVTSDGDTKGYTETLEVGRGKWWDLRWVRHKTPLPEYAHESVFAWMTDSTMVDTAWRSIQDQGMRLSMAFSLDHSIHFHRPFRADQWLLFSTESHVSLGARGLARLAVYTEPGVLVATVQQEVLMRVPRSISQAKMAEMGNAIRARL